MPSERIPELIPEQDVAALLDRQDLLVKGTRPGEGAEVHLSGISMALAGEIYLRECYALLAEARAEDGPHGDRLLDLIDYQVQLRAFHLDHLQRINLA
jgi:hypothetical protein